MSSHIVARVPLPTLAGHGARKRTSSDHLRRLVAAADSVPHHGCVAAITRSAEIPREIRAARDTRIAQLSGALQRLQREPNGSALLHDVGRRLLSPWR
jgi:hypothetical protein